jgi:hypothetical protein
MWLDDSGSSEGASSSVRPVPGAPVMPWSPYAVNVNGSRERHPSGAVVNVASGVCPRSPFFV